MRTLTELEVTEITGGALWVPVLALAVGVGMAIVKAGEITHNLTCDDHKTDG